MKSYVLKSSSGQEWERRVFIHESGAVFLPSPLEDELATLAQCKSDKAPFVEDKGHYYFNTMWLRATYPEKREQLAVIMQSLADAGLLLWV